MPEERKLVTMLFADVTGSTALGEALDPEDVRALMGRYFQLAQEIVPAHGGTLEKFIGDAVMAVFGLPQAHGNDAERALAAALALRTAVAGDSLLAGRLQLRVGVNIGEVVASNDATRGEFLVTGDAVNVVARLEQAAAPGEILASERTKGAAEAAMRFGTARQIEVKGKRQSLRVHPLLGSRPTRQMGRPPLVGRKQDLAQLALLRDRALAERRPQLVSIVAPAGTGKTRLLEEFLARLPRAASFRVATARCLPYGEELTYWPLRGLLDELLGDPFTLARVADVLAAGGHSADEAAHLASLVLATLGIEPEGPSERERIFAAWRTLLEALARRAPHVVVFEDLHWASDSLLDLVEYVMHPRTQAALLLISTSRPELLDRRPGWGGGRRSFTALALDPLTESETRTLVGALAKKVPESTRAQIVERSGGNPFFTIELTRTAVERDRGDAATQESRPLLPDTVHEAVQARLDQLAPSEKHVLQAAAVAGRTFRAATLEALVPEPARPGIAVALDGLLSRDLIAPADSEADAYAFRHVLIRDVAYGTLARGERVRLHASVAGWLERFAAGREDEFTELIAYHYREAVRLAQQSAVPIALPFEVAVAVRSLERAGEVAARIGAVLEARNHLEAAIALAPAEEHLRLYERLGDGAAIGDAGLAAYEAALMRWREQSGTSDPLTGARLLRKALIIRTRWQGSVSSRLSEPEMQALRAEAHQLAEAAGDEEEQWRLRVVDLFWPFWLGSVTPEAEAEGRRLGPEATAYFEAREQWDAMSEAMDAYGGMLMMVGAFTEDVAVVRKRLALPSISYLERGDACASLTQALCEMGDYAGSVANTLHTVETLGAGLSPTFLGNTSGFGAFAACLGGQWTELDEIAARLGDAWEAMGRDPGARYLTRGFFAMLHVARARDDRAAADRAAAALGRLAETDGTRLIEALTAAYRHDDIGPLEESLLLDAHSRTAYYHIMALVIAFLSERGEASAPTLHVRIMERTEGAFIVPLRRMVAVAQALASGDNALLAAAIEEAEAQVLVPHAARMRIVLAQRTRDPAPLERARPVLQRLGDRQFLRRLEEVRGALA
jgi:class 3 adenylate cyclase